MAGINTDVRSSKTYDVVIFGASGFTGKYVIREALKFLHAPNSPLKSLALAGRSPSRLSEALAWASASNPPPQIPLLTADTSDPDSLARLASQARIILDCVGPFRLYGQPVVAACVDSGCDYLDICGEPDFMERMEASYHDTAVENGSLVVSACGFDSVPAEIGLLFHLKHWVGPSAPSRVEAYLSLESDKRIVLNFGTYESAVLGVANADKLAELRRSRLRRARPAIPGAAPPKGFTIEKQKQLGLWALRLPSADSTVVQRTQATLAENPHGLPGGNESVEHVKKREDFWSSAKPAHFGIKLGSKSLLGLFPMITLIVFLGNLSKSRVGEVGRWLLLKYPSFFSLGWFRNNGPSEEEVASATFKMWFVGQGYSDGSLASQGDKKPDTEVVTRVMGPEIGYLTTPIVLLQCALVLLEERDNLPKGGVYTPGLVFGPTDLQKRLQENGISFDFISKRALSSETLLPASSKL
ncbi:probable mitochondrial saccharopine dehydrogenase-like oxidoreductase At5g39410 [Salvia miltiorrhiza]|uniref:probable mitochondrial saccharopine dehydrogenase-like oxidoreductase At5g39410 n=1 Tax=Salvia miltiorrhiza TaxID=226208 RepID=UPI0025AD33E6|nr:probable mitochondrial saccharopine dehydrogenase-like oxidoreductase At5g39410 [Salvia miltiorrhiza]